MKIKVLVFSLSFILFSCGSEQNTLNKTKVFNSTVATSLAKYKKTFDAIKTEMQFSSGKKANSCSTYSKETKVSKIAEGVNNQLVKSEYLVCDVLMLLGNEAYSISKFDTKLSHMLSQKLDLRSFPSSFGPRLDDKNYTLEMIAASSLSVKSNSVVYESEDWYYKIELIAMSDVNGNKKEDWILWVTDESKDGNYRNYQTLVVYDVDMSKNNFSAQVYPTKH